MTKRTVLSHFYNEEYLLPWWLKHHRKIFDHGIMVDYDSTDRSRDIIRELCPTWEIVTSRHRQFECMLIDQEIADLEANLSGWRMCLNTTEFLYGNYDLMHGDEPGNFLRIPSNICIDPVWDRPYDPDIELILQCQHGVDFRYSGDKLKSICTVFAAPTAWCIRMGRSAHTHSFTYPVGRHFFECNTEDLVIFWHGWSPMNAAMVARKSQIKTRIPGSDFGRSLGRQHNVTEQQLIDQWERSWAPAAYDMSPEIDRILALHDQSIGNCRTGT